MSAGRELFCLSVSIGALLSGLAVASPAIAEGAAGKSSETPKQAASTTKGEPAQADGGAPVASAEKSAPAQPFDIDDFAVVGADKLSQVDVEEAIYPFLGPNKTAADVE